MKIRNSIVALFLAILIYGGIAVTSVAADYSMEICGSSRGAFKSFMPMSALSKRSTQYKMLSGQTSDIDNLRVTDDGYYAVAMGKYYGSFGDKLLIEFANGASVKVIIMEYKADNDTSSACYQKSMASDGSIIEPIITTGNTNNAQNPSLQRLLYKHGNAGMVYAQFGGNSGITRITKITGEAPVKAVEQKQQKVAPKPVKEARYSVLMYLPNIKKDKVVFLDTEFMPGDRLVQAAFIIYERDDDKDHFFLTSSLNLYVNTPVSEAFEKYTGIKAGFLGNEGMKEAEAKAVLQDYIQDNCVNDPETLVVGHAINQDLNVLLNIGCNIDSETFDTHKEAKTVLKKPSGYKLSDLLLDAGKIQEGGHDAYQDALATADVFQYLHWVVNKEQDIQGS